jgi:hypothetical protein
MKHPFVVLILALVAATLLSGCYAQKYVAGAVEKPTMMSGATAEPRPYDVIKKFSITDRSGWFILGLIPSGHTNLNSLVMDQVKAAGGDAVINLTIETKYDVVDILVTVLVGGIYNTRVSIVEGEVIKYR